MKYKYKNYSQDNFSVGTVILGLIFVFSIGLYAVVSAQNAGPLKIGCYSETDMVAQAPEGGCPLPQTVSVQCAADAPNMFYEKDSIRCLSEKDFAPKKEGTSDLIICARLGKQVYSASMQLTKGCYKGDTVMSCPFGAQMSGSTCTFPEPAPDTQNNTPSNYATDPQAQWSQAAQLLQYQGLGKAANIPMVHCKMDVVSMEYDIPASQGCLAGAKVVKCPKNHVKGKGKKANTCVLKKMKKAAK